MCEYGHGYEHGYIGHEHAPYYPHHHMHEHHEHRQPLTKEKEGYTKFVGAEFFFIYSSLI